MATTAPTQAVYFDFMDIFLVRPASQAMGLDATAFQFNGEIRQHFRHAMLVCGVGVELFTERF
ncbi:hypothetical protein D3C86_2193510 [compost metagenome]